MKDRNWRVSVCRGSKDRVVPCFSNSVKHLFNDAADLHEDDYLAKCLLHNSHVCARTISAEAVAGICFRESLKLFLRQLQDRHKRKA